MTRCTFLELIHLLLSENNLQIKTETGVKKAEKHLQNMLTHLCSSISIVLHGHKAYMAVASSADPPSRAQKI